MPRFNLKPVDWAVIAKKILPTEAASLAEFRGKTEGYIRRLEANPPEPPAIDWAYYEKNISAPGLVDKFKKSYESMNIPYPEDKYSHVIEEERKKGVEEIAAYKEMSAEKIREATAILEYYERLKPVKDWNMEEAMQIFDFRPVMALPLSGLDLDHRVYVGKPEKSERTRREAIYMYPRNYIEKKFQEKMQKS